MNVSNLKSAQVRLDHYDELIEMSLKKKIEWAEFKIKEFLLNVVDSNIYNITLSFSGGKDSLVLLDMVCKTIEKCRLNNDERFFQFAITPAYAMEITFNQTLEYTKKIIQEYQSKYEFLDNLKIYYPKKSWGKILRENGYPIYTKQFSGLLDRVLYNTFKNKAIYSAFGLKQSKLFFISKKRLFLLSKKFRTQYYLDNGMTKTRLIRFSNRCCDYVKGRMKEQKGPSFVGLKATESKSRKDSWIKEGCNVYHKYGPASRPLMLWTDNNIWEYIKQNNLQVNPMYEKVYVGKSGKEYKCYSRLGCISCPMGAQFEQALKKKNPEIKNRFECLYDIDEDLFQSHIINSGMWQILCLMGITIPKHESYMMLFEQYQDNIKEWYKNFRENFITVLLDIENNWEFTFDELNKILATYKEPPLSIHEISDIKLRRAFKLKEKING